MGGAAAWERRILVEEDEEVVFKGLRGVRGVSLELGEEEEGDRECRVVREEERAEGL